MQKGTIHFILIRHNLVQFQKLFKVVDADRVSRRGMQELMGDDKLDQKVEKYALYKIQIQWDQGWSGIQPQENFYEIDYLTQWVKILSKQGV